MRFREITLRKYYGLLILGLTLFIIAFFLRTTIPFLIGVSVVIFVICGIGISSCWRKTGEDKALKSDMTQVTVYISAGLYGIIAGFAIKNAIESTVMGIINQITLTFEDTSSTKLSQILLGLELGTYEVSMFFVFLATAIPFYHGAMIFLSKESHQKPEHIKGMILHFGFLFIQAMIFLTISLVLHFFILVISLLILLMIIDSIWIILSQKTLHKPPLVWLSTNLAFSTALLLIVHPDWNPDSSAPLLALAAVVRTVIDYFSAPEVYFPKKDQSLGI